jgi:hypothetical protein
LGSDAHANAITIVGPWTPKNSSPIAIRSGSAQSGRSSVDSRYERPTRGSFALGDVVVAHERLHEPVDGVDLAVVEELLHDGVGGGIAGLAHLVEQAVGPSRPCHWPSADATGPAATCQCSR